MVAFIDDHRNEYGVVREIRRLQELEREHRMLQEEHALLKKLSGSVPNKGRDVHVHRSAPGIDERDAPVRPVWRDTRRLLRVASAPCQSAPGTGPETSRDDGVDFQSEWWDVWKSTAPSGPRGSRLPH